MPKKIGQNIKKEPSSEIYLSSPIKAVVSTEDLSLSFTHESYLQVDEETVPLSIFGTDLGVLESVCIYLHDHGKRSWTEMGRMLSRSPKTIFAAYHAAKKKMPALDILDGAKDEGTLVPLSIFRDDSLGPLEALSSYLRQCGVSTSSISMHLNRNIQTIFTSLRRARLKQGRVSS